MVLKLLLLLFCLQNFSDPLTDKYAAQVNEAIEKGLQLKDTRLVREKFTRGELHKIYHNNTFVGHVLIAEVAACNLGGCTAFENIKKEGNSEYFDLLMVIDVHNTIKALSILDYFSDYGYEITSRKYLKKYLGKNISEFSNDTDGIDAISGATISSYALEGMISLVSDQLKK
jgi:hypothetical protein